jgi:hypothetical protein
VVRAKVGKNAVSLISTLEKYVTALQYERIYSNAYIVVDTTLLGWEASG